MGTASNKSTKYLNNSSNEKIFGSFDPIGEIKNRAREIWIEHGRPSDRSWEDFTDEAEESLLTDFRGGFATKEIRPNKKIEIPVSPELKRLRAVDDSSLLKAIAYTTHRLLNAHEIFCLVRLLAQSSFRLTDSKVDLIPSNQEIAIIAAHLAGEYPTATFGKTISSITTEVPLETRSSYWLSRINKWLIQDTVLNFSDRNTMQRFHQGIIDSGIVNEIKLRDPS